MCWAIEEYAPENLGIWTIGIGSVTTKGLTSISFVLQLFGVSEEMANTHIIGKGFTMYCTKCKGANNCGAKNIQMHGYLSE